MAFFDIHKITHFLEGLAGVQTGGVIPTRKRDVDHTEKILSEIQMQADQPIASAATANESVETSVSQEELQWQGIIDAVGDPLSQDDLTTFRVDIQKKTPAELAEDMELILKKRDKEHSETDKGVYSAYSPQALTAYSEYRDLIRLRTSESADDPQTLAHLRNRISNLPPNIHKKDDRSSIVEKKAV